MSLEHASLDNGLSVYVDRVPGANTNNVAMFVPYGSVNEARGDEGVAHAFDVHRRLPFHTRQPFAAPLRV